MRKIFQKGSFEIIIEDRANPEIIDLFGSTVLGTPGKIRYQFAEVTSKMTAIRNCYYLTIRKGGRLFGTVGFVKRNTFCLGKSYDSWYVRYFSIKSPLRAKVHKESHPEASKALNTDNIFKSLASEYFENPYLFLGDETPPTVPALLYGVVEKGNIRSQQFTRVVGFETIREFCTVAFSRTVLRKHSNISKIEEKDKAFVLSGLADFYRGHTLFTTENLFFNNNYLVCIKDGEIVAGLQANPEIWRVVEMPGFDGFLLMKILPNIPGISSFYNPEAFRFIAIEGVYYKEGFEDCIIPLIETAMYTHKAHFALTWMDTGSPVLSKLQKLNRFGAFSKFISRIPADIKCKFSGCAENEQKVFYDHPVYLSCFDMT